MLSPDILEAFILDLRPKYILPSLLKANVISEEESNIIFKSKAPESQVVSLWNILKEKPPDSIHYFEKALREEDAYPWLADLIDNDQCKNLLVQGGIPFETNNLVKRDEIFKIRMHLCNKEKRKWIVLHGMRGNGKAVLAAEAVRNAALIKNNYPNGIFWISVGNVDNNMSLLLKMECLYEMLHGDHDPMNTLCSNNLYNNEDNLNKYKDLVKKFQRILRCEISKRNYEVLVILHDVWTQDVIDAFDIGCSILVTTNKQDICEKFSSFTHKVSCENGMTLVESKLLLAKYVKCEVNALPETIENIHIKCGGSPLLLTRIGIMMSPYGNDKNHWNRIKEKLLDPKEGIRTTVKDKIPCKDVSSIFKKNIQFCLDSFKDSNLNLHQHFYDLGIFPENVDIPKKVLSIFWAKEDTDVEDIMNNLYQISLVQKKGDDCYSISGIYLEIIRETVDLQ
ncbi:Apoptotic protease-activating factor 1, partial [Stegodyphus mimosarum]